MTDRTWTPIPGTRTREACEVSDSVRVVKERIPFNPDGPFSYEVQITDEPDTTQWLIAFIVYDEGDAFTFAEQIAFVREETVTT